MAATDYVFVTDRDNAYLVKTIGSIQQGFRLVNSDRRPITESELIGLFEFFLRKCRDCTGDDSLVISNDDGKPIFVATLIRHPEVEPKNLDDGRDFD